VHDQDWRVHFKAGVAGGFRGRQAQVQEIGLEAVTVDVVGFAQDAVEPMVDDIVRANSGAAASVPDMMAFSWASREARQVRFAPDSLVEGDGFEPSVPCQKDNAFRDSSFPTCARATAAFENARRPVQQLLLPVVDLVRMNAELTRQLGDRPVPPTAATTPSL
jgi:hypothetical protein